MPTHAPTLNTTILLLVSHAILRVVIQETLQHEGYSVYPAGDLGTAVDKLKESKPDLLIAPKYRNNLRLNAYSKLRVFGGGSFAAR